MEITIIRFHITNTAQGKTALEFLSGRIVNMSPQRLEVAFFKGLIQVNKVVVKEDHVLCKGDEVEVDTTHFQRAKVFPEKLPLDIVYEDAAIILLHKQSGMPCHAGLGVYHGTLLNALAWYYKEKGIIGLPNGLVHRLDRGTSGLMLCAKTKEAYQNLSGQMLRGEIKRSYFAGSEKMSPELQGSINAPLKRESKHSFDIRIDKSGKPAITHYEWIGKQAEMNIYRCKTEYGRTHQVRIHLASIGIPILGDTRYGGKESSRLFLCSASIAFKHPVDGTPWELRLDRPDF
ncbi:MAG: RluA family pseudouridine synthase [Bacteroidia bacterium]